eukprot:4407814-Alexandrium_andersonii.AAC.1
MPVPTPEAQQGANPAGPPTVLAPAAAETVADDSADLVDAIPLGATSVADATGRCSIGEAAQLA